MDTPDAPEDTQISRRTLSWRTRIALLVFLVGAVAVVWITNNVLTERFTASTKNRAEVRQALYVGNLTSELERTRILPLLIARDPLLKASLNSNDFSQTSKLLIDIKEEIGTAGLYVLDAGGRVVASSDRAQIGSSRRQEPYFIAALRAGGGDTVFNSYKLETGVNAFNYAQRIEAQGELLGVIVVDVDLRAFEQTWNSITDAVFVADSTGEIILATESNWRGLAEEEALAATSPREAIDRAIHSMADWAGLPAEALFRGGVELRTDRKVGFRGWQMVSFTSYASVRERVNGILALEIMGFAILLALGFYLSSRRATARASIFQRESAELRRLNENLQQEIAERQRVEKNLQVAEQTLAQSSKLAVLGEMSASVSHELNQPLAAMKTYLAGAKLLLQRRRPEEALSSFLRIDDLIERMGAITRQLKSYARKGGAAVEPVDARDCISSALSMMEPQLKSRKVRITSNLPVEPVMVMADPVRLDQVLINLLRNALDATKDADDPRISIIMVQGETATFTVRDNGPGIADLKNLFEPFYTTKAPGDGVGLGLAISSGIVAAFGGRMTARNGRDGGAVFEIQLPLMKDNEVQAAE